MIGFLSLAVAMIFIIWAFRLDSQTRPKFSWAIWIPTLWVLVRGSRNISYWFGSGFSVTSTADYLEGSPMDRNFALLLMVAAAVVLVRRRFQWSSVLSNNKALVALFLYMGLTCTWSDFPLVSFKRWIKEIGSLIILLVILTETDPLEAFRAVFVRCGLVCFTLSIPLYKYFPAIGRSYGMGGGQQVTGVTYQKNELGEICLVFGFILAWDLLQRWHRRQASRPDQLAVFSQFAVLAMGIWLLIASKSQTALVCALLAVFILVGQNLPFLRGARRLIVSGVTVGIPLLILGMMFLRMGDSLIASLGRDMTFTGRTNIWARVLGAQDSPWLGAGFYSFWLGDRVQSLWEDLARITTAHNGYIETYLDAGYFGLGFLLFALAALSVRISRLYLSGDPMGGVALASLAMTLLLNFAETSFFRLTPLWLLFLFTAIRVPGTAPAVAASDLALSEDDTGRALQPGH